jgi:hypothetical protein
MSGFGSFSQEAYQQLQEVYAAQLLAADEAEQAGVQIGNEKFSVETEAISSPWLEKTGLWQYPSGKGDYADTRQSPEDLLAALRNEDGDVEIKAEKEEEEEEDISDLSAEELDALVNRVLNDLESEEEGEEGEDEDVADLTDEEIDALVNEILEDINSEEEDGLTKP